MEIRPALNSDIATLERWHPTGLTQMHERRFARQEAGLAAYLIAWSAGFPVGSCEIRWDGCAADKVHAAFPDCPELNGLQVRPESRQGQGVGTALIGDVEARVRARGFARVGLGVDDDNVRAAALYARLGYEETGCRYVDRYFYFSDDGVRHDVADPCRFLVKQLVRDQ